MFLKKVRMVKSGIRFRKSKTPQASPRVQIGGKKVELKSKKGKDLTKVKLSERDRVKIFYLEK